MVHFIVSISYPMSVIACSRQLTDRRVVCCCHVRYKAQKETRQILTSMSRTLQLVASVGCVWREMASRVYDSPDFLESDSVTALSFVKSVGKLGI